MWWMQNWGCRVKSFAMENWIPFHPFVTLWSSQVKIALLVCCRLWRSTWKTWRQGLCKHFPEWDNICEQIRNPFLTSVEILPNNHTDSEEEQFWNPLQMASWEQHFSKRQQQFWLRVHSWYPALSDKAVQYLLPFPTSHSDSLCWLVLTLKRPTISLRHDSGIPSWLNEDTAHIIWHGLIITVLVFNPREQCCWSLEVWTHNLNKFHWQKGPIFFC